MLRPRQLYELGCLSGTGNSTKQLSSGSRVRDNERKLMGALQLVGRDRTGALVGGDPYPPNWSTREGPSDFAHWLLHAISPGYHTAAVITTSAILTVIMTPCAPRRVADDEPYQDQHSGFAHSLVLDSTGEYATRGHEDGIGLGDKLSSTDERTACQEFSSQAVSNDPVAASTVARSR
jgi:hypothetical protein